MNPIYRFLAYTKPLIDKALTMPYSAAFLLLSGVGSIGFALTLQWGFDVPPCDLCIWQRCPYLAVAVFSFICLLWRPYRRQTTVLLYLCALTFIAGVGLAILHSGVERHLWKSPTTCVGEELKGNSIEEIRKALLESKEVPCDEIPWAIFGLSMANLNIAGSIALAFFAVLAARTHSKKRQKE